MQLQSLKFPDITSNIPVVRAKTTYTQMIEYLDNHSIFVAVTAVVLWDQPFKDLT